MIKIDQKGIIHIAILLIVSFLLAGGVGWYVWQKNQSKNDTVATNLPSDSQPVTLSDGKEAENKKDPYQGWKTYTDDTNGISFKYPSDWSAENSGYGQAKKLMPYTLSSPDKSAQELVIGGEEVVSGSSVKLSIEARYDKTLGQLFDDTLQAWPSGTAPPKEARKVNEKDAYEYEYGYEGQTGRSIVFVYGDYFVTGTIYAQDVSKNSRDYPLLEKILESVEIK